MKFRIYTERVDYARRERLAILIEGVNGVVQVAAPLKFEDLPEMEPGQFSFDEALSFEHVDGRGDRHRTVLDARALIQAFMDHGWDMGMRPTGVSDVDTTKQVAALGGHLDDMRLLVFGADRPSILQELRDLRKIAGELDEPL